MGRLQNVPLKVSIVARRIIIAACLSMRKFSPGIYPAATCEELRRSIRLGFMVIPAAALIIAVVALVFGFKLTKDKVDQYAQEIASRS